jgi:transposase-like protein
MATWKSTPDERAQAAQLVLTRVDGGATLAESIRHFAKALEVSEDTLRRWVRQQASAAAGPVPTTAATEAEPVATSVVAPSEPPRPAAPRRPYALRLVGVIAAVVVVAILVPVLLIATLGTARTASRHKAEARVSDYIAGKGVHEFVASDSNFRASFPFGAPRRQADTQHVGAVAVDFVNYGTEADRGAFMVGSFALPAGVSYDLNAGVNGAAVATKAHVETATPTTFQGFRAIEFVMTGTQSGNAFTDKGVFVDAGTRVYVLQTIWEGGVAPGYDAFKASFHIG